MPAISPDHVEDERLEQYALGTLPDGEVPAVEEHLLTCARCQDRFDETKRFIDGVKSAGPRLREEDAQRASSIRRLLPGIRVAAWAAAAALFIAGAWSIAHRTSSNDAAPVVLIATRGAEATAASAPAGRPLDLTTDASDLGYSALRFVVVDRDGRTRSEAGAVRADNRASASIPELPAGTYFVRLYGEGGAIEREFRLDVK